MKIIKPNKRAVAIAIMGLSFAALAFSYTSGHDVGENKCQPQFGLGNLPTNPSDFRDCCSAGCNSFPHPDPNNTVGMCIDKCMKWNIDGCPYTTDTPIGTSAEATDAEATCTATEASTD